MSEEADSGGRTLSLEVLAGNATGQTIEVDERLTIGRHSDAGRLADDPELSREHAEIVRADSGEYTIADLGSTNGTIVNGRQVDGPVVLAPGDIIEVGVSRLIVRAAPSPVRAPVVDVRAPTVLGSRQEDDEPAGAEPAEAEPTAARLPPAEEPVVRVAGPSDEETQPLDSGLPADQPSAAEVAPALDEDAPKPRPSRIEVHLTIDLELGEVAVTLGDLVNPIRLSLQDPRLQIQTGDQ